MVDQQIIDEWIQKAEEDYLFAQKHLKDEDSFFSPLCFHCQQAAEKYLKAFIVAKELPLQKIHDLKELVNISKTDDPTFGEIESDAIFLNPFYIDTRYPTVWPVGTTRKDAEEALLIAGNIRDFVKRKLNFSPLHPNG